MTNISTKMKFPVLPIRDIVMFPKMIVPFFVGREKSISSLENIQPDKNIMLVAQKDAAKDDPRLSDLYKVGVLSKVLQFTKLQDETVKVLIEGIERYEVEKFFLDENKYVACKARILEDKHYTDSDKKLIALKRSIAERFDFYLNINKKVNPDLVVAIHNITSLKDFFNIIASHVIISIEKKQALLEETDFAIKFEKLLFELDYEIELIESENRINNRIKSQVEETHKNFYLNERLKAIHKELGDDDFKDELLTITKKIKNIKFSKEAREKAESELKKLKTSNPMSSEITVTRNYIDWLIQLPWNVYSTINKNLKSAKEILDKDHYGLTKVKDRILEYLAVSTRTENMKSPIVCLFGPPGVGKTSLAESVAKATGRKFVKISLGGLRDEAEIRGHRRTYVGSMPGKIIQALKKAKTSNPVILLDEIDKMSHDYRGDPSSAILEVLDPSQNTKFADNYLEVEFDLSKIMFIATANSLDMPRPLVDRMEIIKLSGYTEDEKLEIAIRHLLPKQQKDNGLKKTEVQISNEIITDIIRYYTRESGVRELDRSIGKIMRKAVKEILTDDKKSIDVTDEVLKRYLGPRKFSFGQIDEANTIGVTNGLAYTEVGGDLLSIEAVLVPGKGDIKFTGKLGDVMKESVQAAFSLIKSRAGKYNIPADILKNNDIHLHVPEGATPKDGPSAGIAISSSIVSLLTSTPSNPSVAMTGEITLRGKVLPIGGLKEKMLGALRGGVKKVLIPKENLKDLEEIPDNVKNALEIVAVETIEDVLKHSIIYKNNKKRCWFSFLKEKFF